MAFRFVSFPFLVASWACLGKLDRGDTRTAAIVWALWLALTLSPIDVFPIPKFQTPRLVPLVMGLPRRETVERARHGEVILGGCIASGFEPKYYLVW